jgi:hypothetical protein
MSDPTFQQHEQRIADKLADLPQADYKKLMTANRQQFDEWLQRNSVADALWIILKTLRFILANIGRLP